jgi:2-polyprenyl-6-methoxyphenol hydroxylase-like FAD-dependent oxidoreductase
VVDVHRDYVDWDLPEIAATTVITQDPHSWLRGGVTPTVRRAVGITTSGDPVLALGDTAISFDPIGAQGAQGGLIQSAQLVAAARDHTGAFDEEWLHDRFEHFWSTRGAAAVLVTRLFLGDPEFAPYGQLFFPAGSVNPAFGAALFGLLSDPNPLLRLGSRRAARDFIAQVSGEPADALMRVCRPRSSSTPHTGNTRSQSIRWSSAPWHGPMAQERGAPPSAMRRTASRKTSISSKVL